jgi:hypothetical protein
MLKGQAKRDYQRDYMREYMRRRRAGLATAKPRPPKPPPQPKAEPPKRVLKCWFCDEPQSSERILVGDGMMHICEVCVGEAVALIAARKKAQA